MIYVEQALRASLDQVAQHRLPLDARPVTQILPVQPQDVEGVEHRRRPVEHHVVEQRAALVVETDELAVEDRLVT